MVVTVLVTGAAGRIAYSLIPFLLNGSIFGSKKIVLKLYDILEDKLHGIKMEIDDSNFHNLEKVIASTNTVEVFSDVEVAILIGGYPRLPGMERKDLIIKNAESIRSQAQLLNTYGRKDVKVLVVANPANTNCFVALKSAPSIPPQNFSCLTRLDEERLKSFIADTISLKLGRKIFSYNVHDVYIFGNHSTTQVAVIEDGYFIDGDQIVPINKIIDEHEYNALLSKLQNRGGEILKSLQASSAMSAAVAITKHLQDWLGYQVPQRPFSMGVFSVSNPYNIPENLVFSFPCRRQLVHSEKNNGTDFVENNVNVTDIVSNVSLNATVTKLIEVTVNELFEEQKVAMQVLDMN
jgi:malate dehydrogenase